MTVSPRRKIRPLRLALFAGTIAVASVIGYGLAQQLAPITPPTSHPQSAPKAEGDGDGDFGGGTISVWSTDAAVANLEPNLLAALREAATAAQADGITIELTSAWRSAELQQRMFDQAVRDYGSAELAAEWVATPDRSAHVQGLAVDVATTDAYSWLDQHGSEWRLCRTFANEGWHFELRDLDENGYCPQMLPDASADPRRW